MGGKPEVAEYCNVLYLRRTWLGLGLEHAWAC